MINLDAIKIFTDTADLTQIREMLQHPHVRGVTTNPSLSRKAGVENYRDFITEAAAVAGSLPISFEVIADSFNDMKAQAEWISSQGDNTGERNICCNWTREPS